MLFLPFELTVFDHAFIQKQSTEEVLQCNEVTSRYGLTLTKQQAAALVETRSQVLKKTGRIEFGGGVIDKIIYAFCDSPYINGEKYEEILHDLLEIFYEYKNETHELISDDELIQYMRTSFNGVCHGALELLSGRELSQLRNDLLFGHMPEETEIIKEEDEDGTD
jgi:hypothetical protein